MTSMKTVQVSLSMILLSLTVRVYGQSTPVKIYSGSKSQTKTYMHGFVDSPDSSKYAFRYFPGTEQPTGRGGRAKPCEIWICNSDLTGHCKAFTSPIVELGHGSDSICWVGNDRIYYVGVAYQLSTRKVLWQFTGPRRQRPRSGGEPVGTNRLYVSIREDPDKKGYYWLDPSSESYPSLHLVTDLKNLVGYYGGSHKNAHATYIYRNPGNTKLYVVLYDGTKSPPEFAFVLNLDGSVHSYLGPRRKGYPATGHVTWYDDTSLFSGNANTGRFDLNGNLIERLAEPRFGQHLTISPDRKWWVADHGPLRLYRYGIKDKYTVINGSVKNFGDFHPSFSRDGKYVFFQGKESSEAYQGVFRVDISAIIDANN